MVFGRPTGFVGMRSTSIDLMGSLGATERNPWQTFVAVAKLAMSLRRAITGHAMAHQPWAGWKGRPFRSGKAVACRTQLPFAKPRDKSAADTPNQVCEHRRNRAARRLRSLSYLWLSPLSGFWQPFYCQRFLKPRPKRSDFNA